jgi:Uma2 family endonuclease
MSDPTTTAVIADLPTPPCSPVPFEDFLAWIQREEVRAEWVDGEIVVMSPATPDHELLSVFLARLLSDFIEAHGLGLLFTPVIMRLPNRRRGRAPDLLFIATEHLDRVGATHIDGAADLVVEIVSADSIERDTKDKLREYEAAGVREYWLIEPIERRVTFHELQPDGHYQPGVIDAAGIYRSAVLTGFWLKVDWMWQRPLPPMAALRPLLGL